MENRLRALTGYGAIARVSAPAVLINAAVPATVALEMALLARAAGGGDAAQAAFAAVISAVNLVSSAARYLVSGVSAQAGAAAARRRRALLAARARVAVVAAGVIGLVAAATLVAARRPAFAALGFAPAAAAAAAPYWSWRAASIPVALLAQASQGILQGCGWLGTAAGLAVAGSLAEAAAAAVVLRPATNGTLAAPLTPDPHPHHATPLPALGRATLVVACGYAAAALAAAARAVAVAPDTAGGRASRAPSQASLATPLVVNGNGNGASAPAAAVLLPSWRALVGEFALGSFAMLVRSLILQTTFFLGVVVASRQGTAALAAHGVVHTLWFFSAHALDGVETAATVLGSRVAALGEEEEEEEGGGGGGGGGDGATAAITPRLAPPDRVAAAAAAHARLTRRCCGVSAAGGAAIGGALLAASPAIIAAFLRPGAKARDILAGAPLTVLAVSQTVNGPAYAMDGLLASMSLFASGAVVIAVGFTLLYAPLLVRAAGEPDASHVIAGIWAAKLALNCVRVGGGWVAVQWEWVRRRRAVGAAAGGGAAAAAA